MNNQQNQEFPEDFWWGSATAAYQVEGAANEGGRGLSIWDTFSHTPGKTWNSDTGDVACDQYHRFPEDVRLMAELGVKHYRFSISWSRILPQGTGTVNEDGVDYYRRLSDELLAHGITPHATLYHWDLPQALEDAYGGWRNRKIVDDFACYASETVRCLGDRITHWMTLNEIESFVGLGWDVGRPGSNAPGGILGNLLERAQIYHHALLAHGAACQAIRAASPKPCFVSIAENFHSFVPIIETAENIEAAKRAFMRESPNSRVLIPLLTGNYPAQWLTEMPEVQDGDMELIAQPLDGLGFNCYTGSYVRAADNSKGYEILPFSENYPKGNMPWLNIVPESIYWGIRLVNGIVGKIPVFITENGIADGVEPLPTGEVLDLDRIMYYRAYLSQVRRAMEEGYPVLGYFSWSLLDNFEWAYGYSKRFGMIRVDFETLKRTPKLSYRWYQEVIRQNRVV